MSEPTADRSGANGTLRSPAISSMSSGDVADTIRLRQILAEIWSSRVLVLASIVACAAVASVYVWWAPSIYRAEVLIAPAEDQHRNALSRLAGQFGGLASLVGVDLTQMSENNSAVALEVLRSRQFIVNFIKRHDLAPKILAVKRWNRHDGTPVYDTSIYDPVNQRWVRPARRNRPTVPTDWELSQTFLKKHLVIIKDDKTGFVKVKIEHSSPVYARQWLEWLIDDVNDAMRQRDSDVARRTIEQLQEELQKTEFTELRNVFSELIGEQIKVLTLAKVEKEYAFSVIDPPMLPDEPVWPRPLVILPGAGVIGMLIGFVLAFLRSDRVSLTRAPSSSDNQSA